MQSVNSWIFFLVSVLCLEQLVDHLLVVAFCVQKLLNSGLVLADRPTSVFQIPLVLDLDLFQLSNGLFIVLSYNGEVPDCLLILVFSFSQFPDSPLIVALYLLEFLNPLVVILSGLGQKVNKINEI